MRQVIPSKAALDLAVAKELARMNRAPLDAIKYKVMPLFLFDMAMVALFFYRLSVNNSFARRAAESLFIVVSILAATFGVLNDSQNLHIHVLRDYRKLVELVTDATISSHEKYARLYAINVLFVRHVSVLRQYSPERLQDPRVTWLIMTINQLITAQLNAAQPPRFNGVLPERIQIAAVSADGQYREMVAVVESRIAHEPAPAVNFTPR